MKASPIIILGAGRSGTNMLRDGLCQLAGVGTWPCDEINYIWRYGNAKFPFDTLTPAHATERTTRYIRRAFDTMASKGGLVHIVEKTCANTVRVPFVDRIIPEAKYVHIVRDGRDVAASAVLRWTAALDVPYLLKKARFVPKADLPYYAMNYVRNRISARLYKENRLSFWGPRFEELEEHLRTLPLAVACAMQWNYCVSQTDAALDAMDASRSVTIRYEDYLADPETHMSELVERLQIAASADDVRRVTADVRSGNTGKWRKQLSESDANQIHERVGDRLKHHGYE